MRQHAVRSVAAADQSPLAETNDGVVANYRPPISSNRHNVIRDDGNRPRKINARLRGAPCKTKPPPSSRVLLKHNTMTTELLTTPIINMECVTANTMYMCVYVLAINSMLAEQFLCARSHSSESRNSRNAACSSNTTTHISGRVRTCSMRHASYGGTHQLYDDLLDLEAQDDGPDEAERQ